MANNMNSESLNYPQLDLEEDFNVHPSCCAQVQRLEQKVMDLQEEVSRKPSEETKIKELQHLVELKDNELQAERLRADTLQKEQGVVQEKASRDLKQVQRLEEEKRSLDKKVKDLQEEVSRRASKETNNTDKIKELQILVELKENKLQAERLRADTLQKEQGVAQEKASRDLKQVQRLEEEKRSLVQKVGALQKEKADKIQENGDLVAAHAKTLQKKMAFTRGLQEDLDKAKQELVDMRRETGIDVQIEDLKNQLQAERLRSDTLQKEQEVQEKASRDPRQVQRLEEEKRYLEKKVKDLQEEVSRKPSEETNNGEKIKELQVLVELKDNKLQAERLRADILQKEQGVAQEKASRDLKQVQRLEEEKRSLVQKLGAMRKEKEDKIQENGDLVAAHAKTLQKKMAFTRSLQEDLDKAKQELVDMRRENGTDVQIEDLKNQLQAERLRSDTLQKEQEVQEKASRDPRQVQRLEEEKRYLEKKVKDLQEEVSRKPSEETNNADKIKELQVLVELKDNKLQAERLRADILQKEQGVAQEKASRDLKQVQRLEEEKRHLVQKLGAMRKEKEDKIQENGDLVAAHAKTLQKKMAFTRGLQEDLDKAKQELEERDDRLKRKEQELVDLRRETNTDVKIEDLKNQLQAERLRADTLQKEQVDFRREVQQKASQDLKQVQSLEEEKHSLEQTLQEEVSRRAAEETNKSNRIQELHNLVGSLKNQLLAETLRADTLQKEQVDFRREVQQKASQDLKQVQSLEEEKHSLEQELKALQEEVSRRASEETNKSNRIQELQDLVGHKDNQLQTERVQVQERLTDMENVSLWRRFKKAMTPDSRRQYKHLRMQWQDQEENPSPSVPSSPPNVPKL
ncbi:trichohyalin-like isoform X2 [Notolabrus celidotus]|uniref:trichohyalin-like isoform X2 n=1 Tax=Notolabrus celidotus TaxID=1203425 RepID=UPI001490747C|nr:trichohyalin-like isoform X2 [Notolabrus celidotus]